MVSQLLARQFSKPSKVIGPLVLAPLWNRWNQAVKALEAFDAAHPELVAELKSEAEADRKAKYDALSDFVKNGS